MSGAYYNEIDEYAAQWLRNLIAAGLIADGAVDTRSIEDVRPNDLRGFTQCHFFAGLGGWSLALRRAGWRDDRPIWTGSCPCQPFSAAGSGTGFADERHLWPDFHHLIKECRPPKVAGEQVASKAVDTWIDLVQTDMETLGYAFGAVAFPSAGVGAPHIRDRTYWVADASSAGLEKRFGIAGISGGSVGTLQGQAAVGTGFHDVERLAYSDHERLDRLNPLLQWEGTRRIAGNSLEINRGGPVTGFWRDSDWLYCRDDRWRPVESGTFPLANGISSRVGRLRAYGNAINAEAGRVWIEALMESINDA